MTMIPPRILTRESAQRCADSSTCYLVIWGLLHHRHCKHSISNLQQISNWSFYNPS